MTALAGIASDCVMDLTQQQLLELLINIIDQDANPPYLRTTSAQDASLHFQIT